MTVVTMLASRTGIWSLKQLGACEFGSNDLTPEWLQKLGENAAKNLGGTLNRVWQTHDGVYCEVECGG